MIKVTDGCPDGRAVSGKVCGRDKRSCTQHSPNTCMCSPTKKLSESCILGISMEASSCKYDQSLAQLLAPPLENGRWSRKFQASNHGLVFLKSSLNLGAHESPH